MEIGTSAAARGADDWIERVRASSDIVEVVSQTVSLKRVGRNWVGLCPFHQEKTPSFSVHPERQFFHCFSCKAGGDVFKFVQESEKLGFLEAAELLSRRAGIAIPERRAGERGTRTPLLEALDAASTLFEQWLGDPERGRAARDYLEGRGLSREIIREFRLGLALPGWENLAQRLHDRFAEDVLIQAGLVARRDSSRGGLYDRFRHRLMVPLIAPGGPTLGFGARALAAEDQPKYLNSPETPVYHKGSFLFALEQARRHTDPDGEMILVEGYFDTIALHQSGIRNVVATSGTALTGEQVKMLKRMVARVALTFDGDQAGQDAMMRSLGLLLAEGFDVAVVDLPSGEDPDTLVRRGGANAWHGVRRRAADPVEFVQRHGLRAAKGGDARERALQLVVRLATGVRDPVRRQVLLERASNVFDFSMAVLTRAVEVRGAGSHAAPPSGAPARETRTGEGHLEREFLQAVLSAPHAFEGMRHDLSPEDFRDPSCLELARRLWSETPGAGGDVAVVLERELMATAREGTEWERVLEAGARRLIRRRLERQYKAAQQRILQLQRQGLTTDPETVRLLQESQNLARSISELNR